MRITRLTFLAATLAGMVRPVPLHACSCLEYLTEPGEALEKSGLVFVGLVVGIEVVSLPVVVYSTNESGAFVPSQIMKRRAIVTLRPSREWKGDRAKEYRVLAGAPSQEPLPPGQILVDCDVHLEVGHEYLVFASEGYPEVSPCTPTGPLERSSETLAALDRYTKGKKTPRKAPK